MCFYNLYEFSCGCYRWGHFRRHCSNENRTGETCRVKLIMDNYSQKEKCKICVKIETKSHAIDEELQRIKWWHLEGDDRVQAISKAEESITYLKKEIIVLKAERDEKLRNTGSSQSNLASQWSMDGVLLWLANNQFSNDWQETLKSLNIHGSDFLGLGISHGGRGSFGMMHQRVYPRLAKECSTSGTGWDQARERAEGKRLRRLIRGIVKDKTPNMTESSHAHILAETATSKIRGDVEAVYPPLKINGGSVKAKDLKAHTKSTYEDDDPNGLSASVSFDTRSMQKQLGLKEIEAATGAEAKASVRVQVPAPEPLTVSSTNFRPSKYTWEAAAEEDSLVFQESKFNISHSNTAHFKSPGFQPEGWPPRSENSPTSRKGGSPAKSHVFVPTSGSMIAAPDNLSPIARRAPRTVRNLTASKVLEPNAKNRMSSTYLAQMEMEFKDDPKPTTQKKERIAKEIGLNLQQVNVWFQNRRAKLHRENAEQENEDINADDYMPGYDSETPASSKKVAEEKFELEAKDVNGAEYEMADVSEGEVCDPEAADNNQYLAEGQDWRASESPVSPENGTEEVEHRDHFAGLEGLGKNPLVKNIQGHASGYLEESPLCLPFGCTSECNHSAMRNKVNVRMEGVDRDPEEVHLVGDSDKPKIKNDLTVEHLTVERFEKQMKELTDAGNAATRFLAGLKQQSGGRADGEDNWLRRIWRAGVGMTEPAPGSTEKAGSRDFIGGSFAGGGASVSMGRLDSPHADQGEQAVEVEVDQFIESTSRADEGIKYFSDTGTTVSAVDSIFSTFSTSSVSSVGALSGGEERLQALFTTDDLRASYGQICLAVGKKLFEDELRHSLKQFAVDLRKEASVQLEKRTAGYVLHRARNLAHIIAGTLSKGEETEPSRTNTTDAYKNLHQDGDDDSEAEDIDEDALLADSPAEFLHAEQFILQSTAFVLFRDSLLVRTGKFLPSTAEGVASEPNPDLDWCQTVDIKWRCSCGELFSERVTEYRRGAAQELAPFAFGDTTIDIEHFAGSIDVTESGKASCDAQRSQSQLSAPNGLYPADAIKTESKSNKTPATDKEKDKEFILFCKKQETEKTLYHADITMALCDYTSYHILHEKYYGIFKSRFLRWLNFKEISAVDFVKFYLFWGTHVSIDSKDFGVLPPSLSTEYRCQHSSDTNIPVLRTALRHFIQHPDHAQKLPRDRPRIPKKVKEELVLLNELASREGYGLYIQESICWTKVFIVEAIFATACILFAVIWCLRNEGGIQDGFAIAGTGIAYATILLGALQALSQRR